ncbi:ABC transporter ATP-binding protein [Anaerovorax odorimutans]|uniref:ABC transporter ATP-binding protein n=1 Tax=Anaerovorax odorimutans TaxID=109327 RepID=UPI00041D9BF1|nr:ABC transporter ATP-binding protein [Anaerovorax odorimutans]
MDKVILKNVYKEIKGVTVLRDINFTLKKRMIYGLFGHNGSGKTMLLRMIAGLIKPTSGEVYIDGKKLHTDMDFPESIGVIIETPDFWSNYTGKEVLKTLAEIKKIINDNDIDKALQRVGLDPKDKRVIKKYSLGMKQRLGIAQAIMESPDILLLDEPTNALDKSGIELARKIIREERDRGALVVIASHNVADLEECQIKIELSDGSIV